MVKNSHTRKYSDGIMDLRVDLRVTQVGSQRVRYDLTTE